MHFIKRKKWILLCLIAFALYASAKDPKDSLLDAVKVLEAQTDVTFRTPRYLEASDKMLSSRSPNVPNNFTGDYIVPLNSKPYRDLLQSFVKTKAILERGSEERQGLKIGKGKLAYAAEASHQYLELQKRLYFNLLRNTHDLYLGSRTDLNEISALNLQLSSSTALTLNLDDKKYLARFNLWHVQGNDGEYDKVEYGIGAQGLADLEQQAIQEVPSQARYEKLIQLMVVRERMTNRWATNRLIGARFDNAVYNVCAPDLYSFDSKMNDNFYQSLWQADRADEYNAVKERLGQQIENEPMVTEDEAYTLLLTFFAHWKSTGLQETLDNIKNPPAMKAGATAEEVSEELGMRKLEKDGLKTYSDLAKNIAPAIEKEVSGNEKGQKHNRAFIAVADANLPADRWDAKSVADRVAWASYHLREKILIDILVNQAKKAKVAEVLADPDGEARTYAETLIRQTLSRGTYRAKMGSIVLASLGSSEGSKAVTAKRLDRLTTMENKIMPILARVAQADYVIKNVNDSPKHFGLDWKIAGNLTQLVNLHSGDGDNYELGYVPAYGLLSDRVRLSTPDQLSLFFVKKSAFWRKMGEKTFWLFTSKSDEALDISKVVVDFEANEIVMRGIHQFFGELSQAYLKEIQSRGITADDITPDNSPLAAVLIPVMQKSYRTFAASLGDELYGLKGNNYIPLVEDRKKALDLYVHAMSLLNLAGEMATPDEMITWSPSDGDAFQFKIGVPKYKVKASTHLANRVHSPLDMELVLNESHIKYSPTSDREHYAPVPTTINGITMIQPSSAPKLYHDINPLDQVTNSLLDQKFAAEVIRAALIDESPLIAVRERNQVEGPKLADRAVLFYHPSTGLDKNGFRESVTKAIYTASRNSASLIEEACTAKPNNHKDEAFKRIFSVAKNLRLEVMRQDNRYQTYDESLRLEFRTPWETFKDDYWDRVVMMVMFASLLALAIYFAPIAYAGLSSALAGASWEITGKVLAEAYKATASAGGYKALISTLFLSKTASTFTMLVFMVQALVWTHVNCYELPAQLKYQLQVAQSQVGIFKKGEISNSEIERFDEEIHSKRISTYVLIGFQVLFVPSLIRGAIAATGISTEGASALLGTTTKGALKSVAGTSTEAEVLANKMVQPTLAEHIAEDGPLLGPAKYLKNKLISVVETGKITILGTGTTRAGIEALQVESMSSILEADPRSVLVGIDSKLEDITEKGNQMIEEADKTLLISKTIFKDGEQMVQSGTMNGNAGFVKFTNTQFSMTDRLKNWFRNLGVAGLKGTKYYDLVVAKGAGDAVLTGKLLPYVNTTSEIRAGILYEMAKELQTEAKILSEMRNSFQHSFSLQSLSAKQSLFFTFNTFTAQDWYYFEKMMNFSIKNADKPLLARLSLYFSQETEQMAKVRANFRNLNAIHSEWNQVTEYFYGTYIDDVTAEHARYKERDATFTAVVDADGVFAPFGALPAPGQSYSEYLIPITDFMEPEVPELETEDYLAPVKPQEKPGCGLGGFTQGPYSYDLYSGCHINLNGAPIGH